MAPSPPNPLSQKYALAASKGFSYLLPKTAQAQLQLVLRSLPAPARAIYNEFYRDIMCSKACAGESAAAMVAFVRQFDGLADLHDAFAREMNGEISRHVHEGFEMVVFPVVGGRLGKRRGGGLEQGGEGDADANMEVGVKVEMPKKKKVKTMTETGRYENVLDTTSRLSVPPGEGSPSPSSPPPVGRDGDVKFQPSDASAAHSPLTPTSPSPLPHATIASHPITEHFQLLSTSSTPTPASREGPTSESANTAPAPAPASAVSRPTTADPLHPQTPATDRIDTTEQDVLIPPHNDPMCGDALRSTTTRQSVSSSPLASTDIGVDTERTQVDPALRDAVEGVSEEDDVSALGGSKAYSHPPPFSREVVKGMEVCGEGEDGIDGVEDAGTGTGTGTVTDTPTATATATATPSPPSPSPSPSPSTPSAATPPIPPPSNAALPSSPSRSTFPTIPTLSTLSTPCSPSTTSPPSPASLPSSPCSPTWETCRLAIESFDWEGRGSGKGRGRGRSTGTGTGAETETEQMDGIIPQG